MPTRKENQPFIFDSLPEEIIRLSNIIFPDSFPALVILPLTQINTQKKHAQKQWLHKKEVEKLAGLTYKKRHREWLGGRICAKQGLHVFLRQQGLQPVTPEHTQYRVVSEKSGRPFFTYSEPENPDNSFPDLSISHSKDFAAALVSKMHCGVDIQYPAESLHRVKEKFITEKETQLLQTSFPQLSELSGLSLLWAGKEAVKKMLSTTSMPGFHELTLRAVTSRQDATGVLHITRTEEDTFPVAAGILKSRYSLALCCRTDQKTISTAT